MQSLGELKKIQHQCKETLLKKRENLELLKQEIEEKNNLLTEAVSYKKPSIKTQIANLESSKISAQNVIKHFEQIITHFEKIIHAETSTYNEYKNK